MFLGRVIGKIVSTTKHIGLNGKKILIVMPLNKNEVSTGNEVVALDSVGAGLHDIVLVATGTPATFAFEHSQKFPIDASIVSIVDTIE